MNGVDSASARVRRVSASARGLAYLSIPSWLTTMPSFAFSTTARYFSSLARSAASERLRREMSRMNALNVKAPPEGTGHTASSMSNSWPARSRAVVSTRRLRMPGVRSRR